MKTEKKDLHLCLVMSDSYFPIYQKIFSRTLPDEFDSVNILHIRDHDSKPGLVGEENFKYINYKKLEFVAKQLIAHEGDNLLVLDIDVVCFKNFKDEINSLLEDNDMVFQHNRHYENIPYCIGVWGLQCSRKNLMFFGKEVLPRAEVLLFTKQQLDNFCDNKAPVRSCWQHSLNGELEHYAGDQCVINAALLEGEFGKNIKVGLLPDTYAQYPYIDLVDHWPKDPSGEFPDAGWRSDGVNPKDCVLYHATSGGQTVKDKAETLVDVYTIINRSKGIYVI